MTLVNVLVFFQQSEHCWPSSASLPTSEQLPSNLLPLLQIVQRHPLTIEATHNVGVGLELEPAVHASYSTHSSPSSSSDSGEGLLRSTSIRGMTDNLCTPTEHVGRWQCSQAEGGRSAGVRTSQQKLSSRREEYRRPTQLARVFGLAQLRLFACDPTCESTSLTLEPRNTGWVWHTEPACATATLHLLYTVRRKHCIFFILIYIITETAVHKMTKTRPSPKGLSLMHMFITCMCMCSAAATTPRTRIYTGLSPRTKICCRLHTGLPTCHAHHHRPRPVSDWRKRKQKPSPA